MQLGGDTYLNVTNTVSSSERSRLLDQYRKKFEKWHVGTKNNVSKNYECLHCGDDIFSFDNCGLNVREKMFGAFS